MKPARRPPPARQVPKRQASGSATSRLLLALALAMPALPAFMACQAAPQRAASLSFKRTQGTPWDAGVWIDEEFIGPLSYVAAHGVRLPEGKHRITVQKEGYFPWDRLVVATDQPIALDVTLEQVPD